MVKKLLRETTFLFLALLVFGSASVSFEKRYSEDIPNIALALIEDNASDPDQPEIESARHFLLISLPDSTPNSDSNGEESETFNEEDILRGVSMARLDRACFNGIVEFRQDFHLQEFVDYILRPSRNSYTS